MVEAEHPTTRAGRWLLSVVVPSSALALGSLLPIPLIVCSLGAALACLLLWLHPPPRTPRRAAHLVLVAAAILLGATLIQMIPLPASVVGALAPRNADIWSRALSPLKEPGPAWHTISLAPSATRENLLRGLFYLAVFLGGLRVSAAKGGTAFLERLVVASAVIVGFAAFLHPALGAERVFGIYQPRDLYSYVQGRYGPLLNSNHLAAYMNIGACVALGAATMRKPSIPRPISASAACVLSGLSIWAASRGGTGALLVGLLLTFLVGAYARLSRGRVEPRHAGIALVLVMALAGAGLFALGVSEQSREDLAQHDLDKLQLPLSALRLAPLAPIFGVGRGAFESVFPLVRGGTLYVTFTHPENIIVQWLTEWGAPVALLGGGMLALAFRPKNVLLAAKPPAGAWAALVAAILHDFVDFHTEVPGVMALLALCAALLVGGHSSGSHSGSETRGQRALRPTALALSGAVVAAVLLVAPGAGHQLSPERERIRVLAIDATTPPAAFRREIRAAILRYPAESYFPLAGALHAQLSRSGSVVPWVGRALECNPGFGRAHMVLARSLAPRHRPQARLEYRLAFQNDVNLREATMNEAPALVDDYETALELVIDGPDGAPMLDKLAEVLAWRLPATSVRLDAELHRRAPNAPGPLKRGIDASLRDAQLELPWCASAGALCLDAAARGAQALAKSAPDDCVAQALVTRVEIARGRTTEALDRLASFAERASDRGACLRSLAELAMEAKASRHVELAVDRVVRAGCVSAAACADMYAWAGGVEEQEGRPAKAVQLYLRGVQSGPERDDLRLRIGDLGERAGMLREAAEAYAELARRHPDDASHAQRAAELRGEIDRRMHER